MNLKTMSLKFQIKNIIFLLLFSSIISIKIQAQNPDTIWTKTYGGIYDDEGHSMQETSDNGFIITGNTLLFGSVDFNVYLIKTDSSGNLVWSRTYGDVYDDFGYHIQITSDGGFIIAGKSWPLGTNGFDAYLIRTDSIGNTVWTKSYGGIYDDAAFRVKQSSDNGYILVGASESINKGYLYMYVVKTDSSGDTSWTKRFGGTSGDVGRDIIETSDGGYIIGGRISNFACLVKTDSVGNLSWVRTYNSGIIVSIQQTTDSGYILLKNSQIIKTNQNFDLLWERNYGGNDIKETSDSGYIITGKNVSLIKTDNSGYKIWETHYGSGLPNEKGASVIEVADSIYVIGGTTETYGAGNADVYLVKTKPYVRIQTEPSSFFDTLFSGGINYKFLQIINLGNVTLDWIISETPQVNWLVLSDTSGSIASGDTSIITRSGVVSIRSFAS